MTLSYLVSTAGHAQAQNELYPHDVETIVQLLQDGADEFGDEKVVGFTSMLAGDAWTCDTFSYPELLRLSDRCLDGLDTPNLDSRDEQEIVCLLCPTGLDFLVAWIALMRSGRGVVFVAPQCSPAAIKSLYESTSSTKLYYHRKYQALAAQSSDLTSDIQTRELPSIDHSISIGDNHSNIRSLLPNIHIPPTSVSHIFHSSGTSGFPKPIPNTHSRSISVLPRRALPSYIQTPPLSHDTSSPPQSESAAFTTTPLFHGGVSDLLRAWMARSMIYFYPTSDVPVTTRNVIEAVRVCSAPPLRFDGMEDMASTHEDERRKRFRVTAFLSVPYILSTLAEEPDGEGMQLLKEMEMVSTGGAPLETAIGDAMVKKGIRLVSRLGSSECGFLLSSHRDYRREQDWELLRNDSPYADALKFEEQTGAGKYEMVVSAKWTSLTKSNRDDGSYATGDLYEMHPTKPGVWRYVGRGDDVIVMSNGEKASPGTIEAEMRTCPEISNALVVGQDRAQLGLILFPRHEVSDTKGLLDTVLPAIHKANQASPSFAQIAPDMCLVITDPERAAALPKSSKGTVQRISAYEIYKAEIDGLYTQSSGDGDGCAYRGDIEGIRDRVKDFVLAVTQGKRSEDGGLELTTDLFAWGVDSLMASRIRAAISKSLYLGDTPLPRNIVFEQPSIQRLSEYIYRRQQGGEETDPKGEAIELMQTLAQRYGTFGPAISITRSSSSSASPSDILLTGGTGALGSHLIHRLCLARPDAKIICIVRGPDDAAARERLLAALVKRELKIDATRLEVLAVNVSKPQLGLAPEMYTKLSRQVGAVIHAAWPVHFASSLVSFEDQIRGTRNLIDFVRHSPHPRTTLHFCSSIASVIGGPGSHGVVSEEWSTDPTTASPIGYSQSKWVVEKICQAANDLPDLAERVSVLRIGQLCGDTQTGYWNEKEGWPLLLRTCQTTGCLPDLSEEPSWLPVDIAAQTITDLLDSPAAYSIYHVFHPVAVAWQTVLTGLKDAGLEFDTIEPDQWLERVDASIRADEQDPSAGMIAMWREALITQYSSLPSCEPSDGTSVSTAKAQAASSTLRQAPPIRSSDIVRMVEAWRRSGFMRKG